VGAGDHRPGADPGPVLELHPHGPAVPHPHPGHRRPGPDLRARRPGRLGQAPADRPHAAVHPSPRPGVAVDLADPVVHEHVGGARAHRPAPRPDDGLGGQGPLHPVVLEPLVQEVRAGPDSAHRFVSVVVATLSTPGAVDTASREG
jgi:hypothetical protein